MKIEESKPKRYCSNCKHKDKFFNNEKQPVCDLCVAERNWQEKNPREVAYAPRWEEADGK